LVNGGFSCIDEWTSSLFPESLTDGHGKSKPQKWVYIPEGYQHLDTLSLSVKKKLSYSNSKSSKLIFHLDGDVGGYDANGQ